MKKEPARLLQIFDFGIELILVLIEYVGKSIETEQVLEWRDLELSISSQ